MDKFKFELCILWEDELRVAAKSLKHLSMVKDSDSETFSKAVMKAVNTCMAALYGIEDGRALIVSSAPRLIRNQHARRPA